MGRKHKIPKKLVVPTEPMVEEPLKIYHTPEAFYLNHLRSLCARAETPTSLVEGKSLDEHACYVRHRISEKGKLLLDQIHRLQCYAWNLCEIYDITCCSENPKKHLPYQCEFIDNGIVSSYAKGVYNYYDVQQIEEFVAFKGAYEIASLIEKYDATLYKSENFAILKYCYDNYASNAYVKPYIEDSSVVQEETNILQESMEEEIDETVSSLDEKDDEESEEQKEEERISYPCPPSNESNSSTHTLFNFPSCLPKDDCYDDCYDPVDSLEISLFDDACYACGQDANMNYAYGDELAIVPYVKHEIVAIAPTHDSPIIFLNSPDYTISEKFALIKDYIDGLPFTVAHDDFDEYNMHVLAAPTCNYYERGTISPPLYVSNMIKLQETAYTMHWPLLCVHELFFYDMPMHRKRVRLRCCMIYVTLCSLLNYKSLLIKIGFDIPWDPGGSIT